MTDFAPPAVLRFVASTAEAVAEIKLMAGSFSEAGVQMKAASAEMSAAARTVGERVTTETRTVTAENDKVMKSFQQTALAVERSNEQMYVSIQGMRAKSARELSAFEAQEAQAAASIEAMSVKMGTSAEANAAKQAEGFKKVAMGTALVAGVVAGTTLKMAADFQTSTNRLQTSAGESAQGLEVVRKGILSMAGEVGVSAEDMSKAMYMIESASYHGEAGLGVLKAAMQGAKAEGADGAKVANALTSALRDYYPHAVSTADVTQAATMTMSKFVGATSAGKMTFDDLAGSLHTLLPAAMAAGVSMNDALAALASMTVHGVSAEQATQNLAHALGHLQTLTAPQSKEFALLGISAQKLKDDLGTKGLTGTVETIGNAIKSHMDSSGHVVLHLMDALKGLPPEIQNLGQSMVNGAIDAGTFTKATKGLTVEQQGQAAGFATLAKSTHGLGKEQKDGTLVFQSYSEALKAAMGDQTGLNVALMIGGENMGYTKSALDQINKALPDAAGNVKGFAEVNDTFNQKVADAVHGLGAFAISIGNYLLPVASKIASVFADATKWIANNDAAARACAIAIGVVLVGALGAGVIGIVGWVKNLSAASTALIGTTAKLGGLAGAFALGLSNMDSFAGVATVVVTSMSAMAMGIDGLKGAWSAMGGMFSGAKAGIGNFVSAVGAAEAGVGKFKAVASGVGSFLTGPWGIALGLAVGALALFTGGSKDTSQAVDDLTQAISKDSGELGTNTRAWVASKLAKDDALVKAKALGISEAELTAALLAQGPALDALKGKLDALTKWDWNQGDPGQDPSSKWQQDAQVANELKAEIDGVTGSLNKSRDAAIQQAAAAHQSADDTAKVSRAAIDASGSEQTLAATSQKAADAMTSQKNEAKLLTDQLDVLNGANIDAEKAMIRFKDSVDSVIKSVDTNKHSLDENTAAGRKNITAVLDAAQAAHDHGAAVANQTHDVLKGNEAFAADVKALQDVLRAAGFTKDQIQQLTDKYLQVPHTLETTAHVDIGPALGALAELNRQMGNVHTGTLRMNAAGGLITRYAAGGIAHFGPGGPVSGAGSDTSDDIPSMLSNNEYVQRASAVRAAGVGVMDALNAGNLRGAYGLLGQRIGVSGPPRPSSGEGSSGTTIVNVYPQNLIGTVNDLRDQMLTAFQQRGNRNGSKQTFPAFQH